MKNVVEAYRFKQEHTITVWAYVRASSLAEAEKLIEDEMVAEPEFDLVHHSSYVETDLDSAQVRTKFRKWVKP